MEGIKQWIEAEASGHWFFIAFPVTFLCLFIWFKGRRVRFLIPSLLISIVIINPWFYRVWDELGLYAYWRILWVVPVIPIVAGLIPSITERIQRGWIKAVVAATGVGMAVLCGTFLYNGAGGSFVEAANASKEPDYVVQIADRLLELDEHPRVIAQDPIGVYLRQYSGQIDQLFGRDLSGYILYPSALERNTYAALNSGNTDFVSQTMVDEGFDYLVFRGESGENFRLIDKVGEYGIYRSLSQPTVIKERNELGQVISVTTVDENVEPENGNAGYATVSYSYDGNGNIIRETFSNTDGEPTEDYYGCSGYEREYDQYGHKIMERRIDSTGNAVVNGLGYAEYRREYRDNNLISESYYGVDEKPINCINGYHRYEREYDADNNVTLQRFLDANGNMVVTGSGYAEVHRVFIDKHLIREEYYGAEGKPYTKQAGYAAIVQEWDGDNLVSRTYLDENGQPIERTDGYSKAVWTQDEDSTWNIGFRDVKDNEVPIDGLNLVKDVKTDSNGWTDWITPSLNSFNCVISIGEFNLGKGIVGDKYSCQVEIEFEDVTTTNDSDFIFRTVGSVDGSFDRWTEKNIWNSSFIYLDQAPSDGIYQFEMTCRVTEEMLNSSSCSISFRCDNWSSGAFRLHNIKIEYNDNCSEWSPGV